MGLADMTDEQRLASSLGPVAFFASGVGQQGNALVSVLQTTFAVLVALFSVLLTDNFRRQTRDFGFVGRIDLHIPGGSNLFLFCKRRQLSPF